MNNSEITGVALVMMIIFGWLAVGDYAKVKTAKHATHAGLIECPIRPTGYLELTTKTIWVKDCPEYTKTMKEVKDTHE